MNQLYENPIKKASISGFDKAKLNINKFSLWVEKIDKIELKGIEPHNDISKLERFMIGDLNDKKEEECKILKNQNYLYQKNA